MKYFLIGCATLILLMIIGSQNQPQQNPQPPQACVENPSNPRQRCADAMARLDQEATNLECQPLKMGEIKAAQELAAQINPKAVIELSGYDEATAEQQQAEAKKPVIADYDLVMTADEIAKAEKDNKARFIRDIVGKRVKLTGTVDSIAEGHYTLKARAAISGWTVYTDDTEFLAGLEKGKKVTFTCMVDDMPLMGGASRCD